MGWFSDCHHRLAATKIYYAAVRGRVAEKRQIFQVFPRRIASVRPILTNSVSRPNRSARSADADRRTSRTTVAPRACGGRQRPSGSDKGCPTGCYPIIDKSGKDVQTFFAIRGASPRRPNAAFDSPTTVTYSFKARASILGRRLRNTTPLTGVFGFALRGVRSQTTRASLTHGVDRSRGGFAARFGRRFATGERLPQQYWRWAINRRLGPVRQRIPFGVAFHATRGRHSHGGRAAAIGIARQPLRAPTATEANTVWEQHDHGGCHYTFDNSPSAD